jgi:hypothetical protein
MALIALPYHCRISRPKAISLLALLASRLSNDIPSKNIVYNSVARMGGNPVDVIEHAEGKHECTEIRAADHPFSCLPPRARRNLPITWPHRVDPAAIELRRIRKITSATARESCNSVATPGESPDGSDH